MADKEKEVFEEEDPGQESEAAREDRTGAEQESEAARGDAAGAEQESREAAETASAGPGDAGDEAETAAPEGAEQEDGPSAETQGGKAWAGRKAAKKQGRQDKKEEVYREKIEQLEDRVKRQMAEFENFRKRTDREKQAMFETGARSVLEKILPVIDNFERGLQTVPPENREDPFVDGMDRVYKQLLTELENIGVKPIEAVGQEFDPNYHNAVMQVESEEYETGIIAQELQKGYTYRDTVIRHSMVAVVQ